MGSYASSFRADGQESLASITHPSKSDWITAHADATALAIVEVDRLWLRFQQLGCNEDGVLEAHDILNRPPASNNIYAKHILSSFVGYHDNKELITFETFLNAMKWADMGKDTDKIKAVFNLINNGKPVTKDLLHKVLKRTYPDDTEESIQRLAGVCMEQMDDKRQGFITQFQFLHCIQKLPSEQVSALLEFHIVPPEITQEAHSLFTEMPELQSHRAPSRYSLSDAVLEQIADKIHDKDWQLLANKLHFTGQELQTFQSRHPHSAKEQVFDMLKTWKQREGEFANPATLYRALEECDMNNAALLLS